MDPNSIQLDTMHNMFHYESQSRLIDGLSKEKAANVAKCYLKLYLKQQEVLENLGLLDDLTDDEDSATIE
jgi:hypothetical protein